MAKFNSTQLGGDERIFIGFGRNRQERRPSNITVRADPDPFLTKVS